MTNVLLFGILFMMIFMSACTIYWWKKYGKSLFKIVTSMYNVGGTFKNEMSNLLNEFKIPNQWK